MKISLGGTGWFTVENESINFFTGEGIALCSMLEGYVVKVFHDPEQTLPSIP